MTDLEKFGVRLDKIANDYRMESSYGEDYINSQINQEIIKLLEKLSKEIDSISKEK